MTMKGIEASINLNKLLEGYKRFRSSTLEFDRKKYQELAVKGQSPKTMVVSCCDSRVTPEVVFNTGPGELFVVRNVANFVPPFESRIPESSTGAAIEFAINGLKVSQIVVLGHSMCGGLKAYCDHVNNSMKTENLIGQWVSNFNFDVQTGSDVGYEYFEQAGIRKSIDNLKSYPFIKFRHEQKNIELHGAWFNIENGDLKLLNMITGEFDSLTG